MKYRPEIDGLRTVAVLPVVLFHAGIGPFHGGFAGVDIFFVISGYLITSLIIGDLEAGRFSILNFYERRARRILPALFLVLAASAFAASRFMYPLELNEFSQSVVATLFFSSNIFFWLKSDYFSTAAELKPLLHTWSLAVEEQYYLFFPPLMFFIWKGARRSAHALIVLSLIVIPSFLASLAIDGQWAGADFYLLPFRAWELLVGAIAAIVLYRWNLPQNAPMSFLGLAMIVTALVVSSEAHWPNWQTLLPTLGTVLIILFSSQNSGAGRLLAIRPMVWVGMISYSLYLWHQPLFAFARLRFTDDFPVSLKLALIVVAISLAWLTWRLVEQPFRAKGKTGFVIGKKRLTVMMSVIASVFLLGGAVGDIKDGWPNRTAPSGLTFTHITNELAGARVNPLPCDIDLSFRKFPEAPLAQCVFPATQKASPPRRAILLGDSHATKLTPAIVARLTAAGYETSVATFGGCIPFPGYRTEARDCNAANTAMYRHVAQSDYDLIVLSFRPQPVLFHDYTVLPADGLDPTSNTVPNIEALIRSGLEQLLATGAQVVAFEPVPEMTKDIGLFARTHFAFDKDYATLTYSIPYTAYLGRSGKVLDLLSSITASNFAVVKTSEILCDGPEMACQGIEDGVALYVDDNHLSRFGIEKLMTGDATALPLRTPSI